MFSYPGFSAGSSGVISFRLKSVGSSVKSVGCWVARYRKRRNSNCEFPVIYFLGSVWLRLLLPLECLAPALKRGLEAQVPGLRGVNAPWSPAASAATVSAMGQ